MVVRGVLEDLVKLGQEEARRLNRKVVVSYTEPWHGSDVVDFVAHQQDDYRFYWQRGDRVWGGGGRVWATSAGLESWGRAVADLPWRGMVPPQFWSSLPFDRRGQVYLWLPRWWVGEGRLVVWDWVTPDSGERLAALVQRLRQEHRGTLAVEGGNTRSVIDLSPTWRRAVGAALAAIGKGSLAKVVLCRAVEVVGEGDFSAFGLLERLRQAGGYTTLFLMELGGGKTFVGATPEMLLQFRYHTDRLYLQSDALAGSSALGDTLLASGKDLAEHQIVVDSIVTAYKRVGASVGQIPLPRLLPLNHIQHLYTPIWGEWQTKAWQDVFQLLDLLHPTAAVGGKPRENALAFIRQFESWNREGYAAPIGWFNTAGEGEFAVAIRSGYVEGNRVRMFAGAGIVEDSQIDREWEETNLKLQGMLKALGL